MPELVFPEIVIRNVLEQSLARLLANDAILDLTVSGLDQAERDTIRSMLQMRPGKVRLGWSREEIDDWIITVVLASTKKHATLGEVASHLKPTVLGVALLTDSVDAAVGSVLPTDRPSDVPLRGLVRLEDEIASYHDESGVVRLVGRGLIDATTGQATAPTAHAAGTTAAFIGIAHDLGWAEDDHLRLDVVSSNALFTIVLGRLLPAWLALDWRYFEERGVTIEEATESDVAPRPYFVPESWTARTLMVKCSTKVALPESLVPITDVTADIIPETPIIAEVPSV